MSHIKQAVENQLKTSECALEDDSIQEKYGTWKQQWASSFILS